MADSVLGHKGIYEPLLYIFVEDYSFVYSWARKSLLNTCHFGEPSKTVWREMWISTDPRPYTCLGIARTASTILAR